VALKACTVVVHDLNETAHEVTAESLYEAIALALATLRGHEWVGEIGKGLTAVTVKVRHPEVTHVVKIQDFENWLNRGCKSPADTVLTTLRRSQPCGQCSTHGGRNPQGQPKRVLDELYAVDGMR
jgi:hypothetical protein